MCLVPSVHSLQWKVASAAQVMVHGEMKTASTGSPDVWMT